VSFVMGAPDRRAATHHATQRAANAMPPAQLGGGAQTKDPRDSCSGASCSSVVAAICAAHAGKSFKRAGTRRPRKRRGRGMSRASSVRIPRRHRSTMQAHALELDTSLDTQQEI